MAVYKYIQYIYKNWKSKKYQITSTTLYQSLIACMLYRVIQTLCFL